MAETYCGKTCASCIQKEALNCPGCKVGPGRQYSGECALAKCCRDKKHQECTSCDSKGHCGLLLSKDHMPEYRLKRMESEKFQIADMARRISVLGKWIWPLFWLIIPRLIASLMTNENIAGSIPSAFILGQILSAACSFVYGFILIKLASEEDRYKTAGICTLIGGTASVLIACISGSADTPVWTLLISIPAAIVTLIGDYHEYTGHSIVLSDVDYELSEKWSSLWVWYIGMHGALLGSLMLVVIAPVLGLLVTFGAAIGLIVIGILKLVYLYRTAKVFGDYQVEAA